MQHHLIDGTLLIFVAVGAIMLGRPALASFIGILGVGILVLR